MKQASNVPEVRKSAPLTTQQMDEWGAPVVSQQDVVVPKILLMQGLSVAVSEDKAKMGEFRDSLSNVLMAGIAEEFECIPFYLEKAWDIMLEDEEGDYKWDRTIPVVENPASPDYNDNWKYESEVGGIKQKNVRRFNFYVLLPSEVAKGDAIPYVISFKSKGFKEGKKLFTQMYLRNVRSGMPPAAFHIKMRSSKEKNEKGIFYVPQFTLADKTTDEELSECLNWIKLIRKGSVKVDESDNQVAMDLAAEDTGEF